MNDHPSSTGLTRRSFIKRSVVAAVAVSSMTIFSGLVRAEGEGGTETVCAQGTPCSIKKVKDGQIWQGGLHDVYECTCTGTVGCCTSSKIKCGNWFDDNGNVIAVYVNCGNSTILNPEGGNSARCILAGVQG